MFNTRTMKIERIYRIFQMHANKQNQFDALVSWTYNLGPTNLKQSTMLKVLNESNYDEVPEQIKRWNKASGQVLAGLVKRRAAEAELFVS